MKKRLEILGQQASLPGATSSIVNEYNAAVEKRKKELKYDRERAAIRREHLKQDIADGKTSALEKSKKLKEAKRLSYLKNKKNGQVRAQKAKRRGIVKFQYIKDGLEQHKDINDQ